MKIINKKADKVISKLEKFGWKVSGIKTFDDGKSKNIYLYNGGVHSVLFCENDVVKDVTIWHERLFEELLRF